MPHIGIHRFAAGDREKYCTEHCEGDPRRGVDKIAQRAVRAQCLQDRWRRDDAASPEHGDDKKPYQHHRPEYVADECCALALNQKQPNQDDDTEGDNRRCETRCVHLEAFDGAQNRNRRCDDTVAVEQSGSDQANDQERGAPAAGGRTPYIEQR